MTEEHRAPRRIFIVEDESLLLMLLEELLPEMGYDVAGSAGTVADALAQMADTPFDAAVMDVNLSGSDSSPVAQALTERGIPFLFITGYGTSGLPAQFQHSPVLAKPFRKAELENALARLLAG